ncbi:TPA: hypothetical protein KKW74_002689 [Legionella pneumophila]|uniref:hypothetical protein n=1 Tax=Legionella pneumophila TaxID=446 RepID=UPI0005B3ED19|nr:hypothetical protein [Legionella pneumophila]TIG73074.1 hypothetical protein DI119_15235 [Legionella pneumophila]HAT6979750.1 hypothetical protein [Legionella pneumophila]HAT7923568.1 hypothetical protein [Legionella pneumophila]HAT8803682.1 hypothetical protein [Legionella pneumophila]HAU2197727.1 hypothetical protein [Legionella pneumophila]
MKENSAKRLIRNIIALLLSGVVLTLSLYVAIDNVNKSLEEKEKKNICAVYNATNEPDSSKPNENTNQLVGPSVPVLLSSGVHISLCTIVCLIIAYLALLTLKKAFTNIEEII